MVVLQQVVKSVFLPDASRGPGGVKEVMVETYSLTRDGGSPLDCLSASLGRWMAWCQESFGLNHKRTHTCKCTLIHLLHFKITSMSTYENMWYHWTSMTSMHFWCERNIWTRITFRVNKEMDEKHFETLN